HLAAFRSQTLHLVQLALTVLAPVYWVDDHCIGGGRQHQRAAWVTSLSTGLLATALTQTLGLAMKPIRGGWQMTVVAVLVALHLQRMHLLSQQLQLVLQVSDQLISLRKLLLQQPLFLLQACHFFFGCHILTVVGSGLVGKPSSTRE